jgi:Glycosyl hydrolase family 26
MLRVSESGRHSRSAPGRTRRTWPRAALAVLAAGAAGLLAYTFFPGTGAAPVADQLRARPFTAAGMGSVLGHASTDNPSPAAITTATAMGPGARHKRPPAHPRPTAPASPSASTPPASGVTLTGQAGLGLYDGQSSPSGLEKAAQWLGSSGSIKYAQDFIDATDWSHIENPWQLSNWKGSPFTMVWGVPMLPCGAPATQCSTDVSDFNLVASGGADGYFKTLAQNLVSNGFGSSYIRLGWEMNGNWMGWSICNQDGSGLTSWASDFVPAFRNIVTSMRGVSGANFKFIWNPLDSSNVSCPGASMENFYPGDSYVDAVALDAYDAIGSATSSDSARWSDLLNGVNADGWTAVKPNSVNGQGFEGYGLNWLAAFGRAHGKLVSLPEWGLDSPSENGGGGDDTYFMTHMADWIKAYASGPAIFWNYGGGTLTLNIPGYTSDDTPDATAAFKAAFAT